MGFFGEPERIKGTKQCRLITKSLTLDGEVRRNEWDNETPGNNLKQNCVVNYVLKRRKSPAGFIIYDMILRAKIKCQIHAY